MCGDSIADDRHAIALLISVNSFLRYALRMKVIRDDREKDRRAEMQSLEAEKNRQVKELMQKNMKEFQARLCLEILSDRSVSVLGYQGVLRRYHNL